MLVWTEDDDGQQRWTIRIQEVHLVSLRLSLAKTIDYVSSAELAKRVIKVSQ